MSDSLRPRGLQPTRHLRPWDFPGKNVAQIKGTVKDRNGRDLLDAEEIKKRWKEYTERLHKKNLNEPDNYDGVVSHPEPDILECELKWALGSGTNNEATGCDGILVNLFKTDSVLPGIGIHVRGVCPSRKEKMTKLQEPVAFTDASVDFTKQDWGCRALLGTQEAVQSCDAGERLPLALSGRLE